MLTIRRLLQSAFAFLALIFICAAVMTVTRLPFFLSHWTHNPHFATAPELSGMRTLLMICTMFLSVLILLLPVPLSALYVTTWWTLRSGKPSGRSWALMASIATVLQGIPIFVMSIRDWDLIQGKASTGFLILDALPFLVGIPGIVAFAPRNATQSLVKPEPERVQGDGTSRNMDRFALMVQVAVIVLGGELWWRWARLHFHHRMGKTGGPLLWIAEFATVVFIHELGHIVAGYFCGMMLTGVIAGPLHFTQSNGKWNVKFERHLLGAVAAGVRMIPCSPNRNRGGKIFQIAAGPLASLLSGLVFLYWAATIPSSQPGILWDFCSWTGILSLNIFILNIIPLRSQAFYSDGAKIYQALTHSVLDDYYWILSFNNSIGVTANRPRDYDLDALRRVLDSEVGRPLRVVFGLMESECLLERGLVEESADAVRKAQAAYEEQTETLTAGSICSFVFGHAILCADPGTARTWTERLEGSHGLDPEDRWFCSAALACAEGRKDEAEGLLDKLDQFQIDRAPCGSRELNLLLVQHMRAKLLDRVEAPRIARENVAAPSELVQQLA